MAPSPSSFVNLLTNLVCCHKWIAPATSDLVHEAGVIRFRNISAQAPGTLDSLLVSSVSSWRAFGRQSSVLRQSATFEKSLLKCRRNRG